MDLDPFSEAAEIEPSSQRSWIGLSWLRRSRWVAIGAAVTATLIADRFDQGMPTARLLAVLGVLAVSNAWLSRIDASRAGVRLLGGVLVFDTLALTALLALSGGAANPATVLYLVEVALAAVVLGGAWSWALALLSNLCFATLFLLPGVEVMSRHAHHAEAGFNAHLYGMLIAFAVTSATIVYMVNRISQGLRNRELELAEMRQRHVRTERLAALTTLAAGAAHELGTPLATIALVSKELERKASRVEDGEAMLEDARLIRAEVDRCRTILDQMSTRAADAQSATPEVMAPQELIDAVRSNLSDDRARRLDVDIAEHVRHLELPRAAFEQVLASLVRNAFDASPPDGRVELFVGRNGDLVCFEVRDRGSGMPAELLARAHEPFVTTKEVGAGLGLGLFLATAVAEQLGGRLRLESRPDHGTKALLEVPQ